MAEAVKQEIDHFTIMQVLSFPRRLPIRVVMNREWRNRLNEPDHLLTVVAILYPIGFRKMMTSDWQQLVFSIFLRLWLYYFLHKVHTTYVTCCNSFTMGMLVENTQILFGIVISHTQRALGNAEAGSLWAYFFNFVAWWRRRSLQFFLLISPHIAASCCNNP